MDKTLILIDGSSFIFRAFHAMPNLTAPDNKPTGATYGIVNMLKQLLKKYDTPYWCCVFDAPGLTFRHEIYPEYKATRTKTPLELIPQFEDIYSIIPALGIPVIIESGVEADDVIGTLAMDARNTGYKVVIATGDKDFAQLVDDNIMLINTMNNELLDTNSVIAKFGVHPNQIIDYLTLVGDKVDNIPGVEKCGPKTANRWLTEYGSLENIINNAGKIGGIVGDNLRSTIVWLELAKTLITINTKLDLSHIIPDGIENLTLTQPKYDVLTKAYSNLGFKTWLRQINDNHASQTNLTYQIDTNNIHDEATVDKNITPIKIESATQLQQIIEQLIESGNIVSIHIATSLQSLLIKSIFIATSKHLYIAINEDVDGCNDLFTENSDTKVNYNHELGKLLSSETPKIFINYKEVATICKNLGLNINNVIGDITLAHYILNSKNAHSIASIYKDIIDIDLLDINKDKPLENNIIITQNSFTVLKIIESKLDNDELNLYKKIELPLAKVLVDIEHAGIKLDIAKFKMLENEICRQIKLLEDKIYILGNCAFNINSSKQLQDVLFNSLKLPTTGIRKNTNGYSTDEDSLKQLDTQGFEIAAYIIEYRGLSKLLNTYISKLPKLADINNKVHTTFEQAFVASGRLSSREPNLQNIPVKSGWGRRIRQCFIAEDEHVLICADYSQIELRILTHFSQDQNLIDAFNNNKDIHSITASDIFHKNIEDVTTDERRYAKTINFSLLYGKTVFGLANELNIDRATAKLYIDTYFAKYPKILQCMEGIKNFAREHGYVKTLFGRKIYLTNINTHNKVLREAEERLALNAPMQGTSADIIKIAMNKIYNWLIENNLQSKMILQVHDELILQVPKAEINIITENLAHLMTDGFSSLSVKLTIGIKIASNWDEAH